MKKRKTKKFNFLKLLLFLLIVYLLYFVISYLLGVNTKNIVILNNSYYSDELIIETASLENYPKFILLSKSKIKKKLSKLDLISDVKIKKKYGFILEINVTEKKILFLNRSDNKYMASDNKYYELDNVYGVPTLINYVPENVLKKFVNALSNIDKNVIALISEIEYSKTSYDNERFIFYMNDDYEVIININRMSTMNKYVSIIKSFNGVKGIVHLDIGSYLEKKVK